MVTTPFSSLHSITLVVILIGVWNETDLLYNTFYGFIVPDPNIYTVYKGTCPGANNATSLDWSIFSWAYTQRSTSGPALPRPRPARDG